MFFQVLNLIKNKITRKSKKQLLVILFLITYIIMKKNVGKASKVNLPINKIISMV